MSGKVKSQWVDLSENMSLYKFLKGGGGPSPLAGLLVQVRSIEGNGRPVDLLIGDVNALGGVCDDCPSDEMSAVVLRYMRVYP